MHNSPWVVSTIDLSGVPEHVVIASRKDAVEHFMQFVYLFLHAAPDKGFKVVGNDEDAALTGLYLFVKLDDTYLCVASVSKPGTIEVNSSPNSSVSKTKTFTAAATQIQLAIDARDELMTADQVERLQYSVAALRLYRPLADDMVEDSSSSSKSVPKQVTADTVWDDMAQVKHFVKLTATVLPGDS